MIVMVLKATKREECEDWNSMPIVHFEGTASALNNIDPSSDSLIKGTVRMTHEGEVRWESYSLYGSYVILFFIPTFSGFLFFASFGLRGSICVSQNREADFYGVVWMLNRDGRVMGYKSVGLIPDVGFWATGLISMLNFFLPFLTYLPISFLNRDIGF